MGIFDRLFEKREKKEEGLTVTPATSQDQKRYSDAMKVIAEAENLYQDNSGEGEPRWSDSLVELSPDSIRAISARGWRKRGSAEPANEFLIRVLGRIAKDRSLQERTLAIGVLQSVLDLPDDNTTGLMNLQNACIRELDELKALSGVDYSQAEVSVDTKLFRLEPIDPSQIGPFKSPSPHEKPNLESAALLQMTGYQEQRYEEAVQKFEANYSRWSKTFDRRSLSLVLCAYGFALEKLGRYCDAVLAHRWACKIYPYKGFASCDRLQKIESMAAKELEEKRHNLKDKQEICEYCFRILSEQEQARVFCGRVACEQCDNTLRDASKADMAEQSNPVVTQDSPSSPVSENADTIPPLQDRICQIIDNMDVSFLAAHYITEAERVAHVAADAKARKIAEEKALEILRLGDKIVDILVKLGMSFCDKLEELRDTKANWNGPTPSYLQNISRLKAILFVLTVFCDSSLLHRSRFAENRHAFKLLLRTYEYKHDLAMSVLKKLGFSERDMWRELLLTLPIVQRVFSSKMPRSLEEILDYIEELILDRQKGLENPWGHISGDCFKIGCSYTHAHEVFRIADKLFETRARQISDDF